MSTNIFYEEYHQIKPKIISNNEQIYENFKHKDINKIFLILTFGNIFSDILFKNSIGKIMSKKDFISKLFHKINEYDYHMINMYDTIYNESRKNYTIIQLHPNTNYTCKINDLSPIDKIFHDILYKFLRFECNKMKYLPNDMIYEIIKYINPITKINCAYKIIKYKPDYPPIALSDSPTFKSITHHNITDSKNITINLSNYDIYDKLITNIIVKINDKHKLKQLEFITNKILTNIVNLSLLDNLRIKYCYADGIYMFKYNHERNTNSQINILFKQNTTSNIDIIFI